MLDLINGLPIHPLVVHGVVVLLPLAVIGAIAVVVRRDWAIRFGWLVVGVAAVATALLPVATSSGEALERHVGRPGEHAELGEQLIFFALPLLVLTTVWVYLAHRREKDRLHIGPSWLPTVVAALTIVAALGSAVQVYRVGDSGARATWAQKVATDTAHSSQE